MPLKHNWGDKVKKEVRFLFIFVAIFVIALLSLLLGDKYTWTLPAPVPIGAMVIGFWMFFEGITEVCRGRTEHIIYNHGHKSIREKDIAKIPYHEVTATNEDGKEVSLGDMIIAATGGFDFWGFTMPGGKSDPMLIYPSYTHGKEENNYHCYGNLTEYTFKELPKYIKRVLALKKYSSRVDISKTPFLYGVTSHLIGTATRENLKIEERERELNKDLSEKDDLIDSLYEQIRKKKEADEKQYILGREIKPTE